MTILFKTVLISLLLLPHSLQAKASDLSVQDFFKNPAYSGLQLSPNGKYIALISPVNNRRNIVIVETHNLKKPKQLTGFSEYDIGGFFWANDETIVFVMDNSGGREAFSLFRVNISGKPKPTLLVDSIIGRSGIKSARVINLLVDDPDHLIVQYNGRKVKYPDLYKLPINSQWSSKHKRNSKMKLIAKNPGDVTGWIVDNDGDVRGAVSLRGLAGKFHYKAKGEDDFRVLREFRANEEGMTPVGFDFDNKQMYVASNIGRDKAAIYRFDPEANKMGEIIFGHNEVDVGGLIVSRVQKKLLGVTYFNDYPETVIFDKHEKEIRGKLEAAFPDKRVVFTSSTLDEMLNIILVGSDMDRGEYFLFNRKTNNLKPLLAISPSIKAEDMSPMKPIKFVSRDGLNIRGYITIPKDSDGKNLPLIINPHGGPYGVRDFWRFNIEHQFFASRGYATAQINFRGSGGYGHTFQSAGYGGKWGAEMQNDLTDAVKYLIKEGIADPDKVCIYGVSYGGYATMAGLTFTPELYKCGINYVGVTDVALLFETMPKVWEPQKDVLIERIGDPDDKELMNRMSPLAHVDKIKAPLMIVQGAKDPRVVKQHATDLRNALKDRGITLSDDEWIMKINEGHGFRKEENRIELYTKMEKFLKKHLK